MMRLAALLMHEGQLDEVVVIDVSPDADVLSLAALVDEIEEYNDGSTFIYQHVPATVTDRKVFI
jgi:hypothetical protein